MARVFTLQELVESSPSPPPLLYHFTGVKGLLGILREPVAGCVRLRATDVRFLNDTGEVSFGVEIASKALRKMGSRLGPEGEQIAEHAVAALTQEPRYVSCLSTALDSLPQWRGYAEGGRGYCLAFRVPWAPEADPVEHGVLAKLNQCRYGEVGNTNWVTTRIEAILKNVESMEPATRQLFLQDEIDALVAECASFAKHKHFEEECEWRIAVEPPMNQVRVEQGAHGLTPHVLSPPLELTEVWVGPGVGPDPAAAEGAVVALLRSVQLTKVRVEHWASPMRT